ncbi:hypothetical protein ACWEOZ_29145 [Actinoplanes sp. NPDC004185]
MERHGGELIADILAEAASDDRRPAEVAYITGMLAGLGRVAEPRLAPRPGACCVVVPDPAAR